MKLIRVLKRPPKFAGNVKLFIYNGLHCQLQFQAIVSVAIKQIREVSIKIKRHFPCLHRLKANECLLATNFHLLDRWLIYAWIIQYSKTLRFPPKRGVYEIRVTITALYSDINWDRRHACVR